MALFGRRRDVLLINSINRELLPDIITQQVGYYKVTLGASATNMYGEALDKFVNPPVLFNVLIQRGDQTWTSDAFGPDTSRALTFAFFRDDLIEAEITPEVGDVVFYYENYYEVDSVVDNQYFVGKIPEYSYSEGLENYGSSISIVLQTHLIAADKLGISIERG